MVYKDSIIALIVKCIQLSVKINNVNAIKLIQTVNIFKTLINFIID